MLAHTLSMAEKSLRMTLKEGTWEEVWRELKSEVMRIDGIDNLYTVLIWIESLSRKEGVKGERKKEI